LPVNALQNVVQRKAYYFNSVLWHVNINKVIWSMFSKHLITTFSAYKQPCYYPELSWALLTFFYVVC
jgi:CDP-diglyceride synthetase